MVLQRCEVSRISRDWEEEASWAVARIKWKSFLSRILMCAWCSYIYFILHERNTRFHGGNASIVINIFDSIKFVVRYIVSNMKIVKNAVNSQLQEGRGLSERVLVQG